MTSLDSALVRREFGRAKRAWVRLLAVQIALVLLPLVTLVKSPVASYICALLSLVGIAALFVLKGASDSAYERAEEARRTLLLADALGHAPDPVDSMRIVTDATAQPSGDPEPMGDYYNSAYPRGPSRLIHLVWESAHCTEKVAREAAGHALLVALTGGAVAGGLLISGLFWGLEKPVAEMVADVGVVLLGLFGVGAFAELSRGFGGLSSVARETCLKCEGLLRQPGPSMAAAVGVLSRYDASLSRACPLPSYAWKRHQRELAVSWAAAQEHTGPLARASSPRSLSEGTADALESGHA